MTLSNSLPPRTPWRRALSASFGLLLWLASSAVNPASASLLTAGGWHVGEDHSYEDHSGESLKAIDLSEADLTSIELIGTELKDALFIDALMMGADLYTAILKNAVLDGADLRHADLEDADLKNASLIDALLNGAYLVGADIKNAVFDGAVLIGADLSIVTEGAKADLTGAYYDSTTLLDPSIDRSGMMLVSGPCPSDASKMLVVGATGSECMSPESLPEPGAVAGLLPGIALLLALRRRRFGATR